ncbi:MAG: nucleotide-binding protein [Saprospiraceae bacterium]|nr:nucleotide-binding protein [Saprospiraceae bacterium]
MTKSNSSYIKPPPTELVISREKFKSDLEERINIGNQLLHENIQSQTEFDSNTTKYYKWNDYNSEYLKQSFNNEYNEYKSSYDKCADWVGFATGFRSNPETPHDKLENHMKTISIKLENLAKLVSKAELLKSSVNSSVQTSVENIEVLDMTENIFIVHGHDDRSKIEVARTIEKLGLNPIILSEQPNEGQTIIEKFELHSNVGYAIVILTADDLGKIKTEKDDKYRARQNVILEMGYFIGKLGRSKVFLYMNPELNCRVIFMASFILHLMKEVPGNLKLRKNLKH